MSETAIRRTGRDGDATSSETRTDLTGSKEDDDIEVKSIRPDGSTLSENLDKGKLSAEPSDASLKRRQTAIGDVPAQASVSDKSA